MTVLALMSKWHGISPRRCQDKATKGETNQFHILNKYIHGSEIIILRFETWATRLVTISRDQNRNNRSAIKTLCVGLR